MQSIVRAGRRRPTKYGSAEMGATTMIGARIRRLEDPRLLRGKGSYVDDISLPGILHAALVRSPYGHARITRIDLAAVKAAPGVIDAFTLTDGWEAAPNHSGSGRRAVSSAVLPIPAGPRQSPICRRAGGGRRRHRPRPCRRGGRARKDRVRASSGHCHCDAAQTASAQLLHDTVPGNIAARWTDEIGNVARAFASADRVVREHFRMQRYTGVPMETRGVLATTEPVTGDLTIWASGQWPHTARSLTAALLGLDEQRVRVIQPDVGGGFGVKSELYPEDLLIPLAATRLGRPVKWIENRREHFLGIVHAREMEFDLELAV